MSRQKIIIVVINYGTLGFVRNLINVFLASLPPYPKIRIDWVIADAEDDTEQDTNGWCFKMKREFRDKKGNHFHFYKIPNQGFAANANLGFKLFKDEQEPDFTINDSDLVLLLNPDTILYWSNLEKAVGFMNSFPEASVAGMSLANPKGQPESGVIAWFSPRLSSFLDIKDFPDQHILKNQPKWLGFPAER
jgi:GT2 family glycosyltransferase